MFSLRPLPSLHFVSVPEGRTVTDFSEDVIGLSWKDLIPENFEHNTLKGLLRCSEWQPVLKGFQVLYPGMYWHGEESPITAMFFRPGKSVDGLQSFLDASVKYFRQFDGRLIGVHLSGGLDSSLIIGMLRHFNIPYALVGMSTDRYEFRTERRVQELLAMQCGSVRLIDYEIHLPLSSLEDVPPHEYPDLSSINFSGDDAMADACAQFGIEVLLNGTGGDVVLGTPVHSNGDRCDWQPHIFNPVWTKDVVYAAHGVQLEAFYADAGIVNSLFHLRRGQGYDGAKRWARSYFRDFLPKELTDFTYCADFWGLYCDGLASAKESLLHLHQDAYNITGSPYFEPERLASLLREDLLTSSKSLYQKIESRAALSCWVISLHKFREAQRGTLVSSRGSAP